MVSRYDHKTLGFSREDAARMYANQIDGHENQIIAGGIIIDHIHSIQPQTVLEFLERADRHLNDGVKTYIRENSEWIQEMIDAHSHLDYENDFASAISRYRTYLTKRDDFLCEGIQHCHLRQAVQMALEADAGKRRSFIETVYHDVSTGAYTHATPTIFNAGKERPQMGSCFLLTTEDDTDSITKTWEQIFKISRDKGGIGLDVSRLRHSKIGLEGISRGVIPELQVVDKIVSYGDQTGLRKGGCTVYLAPWHIDTIAFIDLCLKHGDPSQRAPQLFTALWCPDLFFHRIIENGEWSLFCPNIVKKHYEQFPGHKFYGKTLADVYGAEFEEMYEECESVIGSRVVHKARDIYTQIIESQKTCGRPFIIHADHANYKNNQPGILRMSNLCTEIFEVTSRDEIPSCNLASINLRNLVQDEKFDFKELARVTRQLVENISFVIHQNSDTFPTEIGAYNRRQRPMGIGVSGFAEMLYKLDLHFAHPETKVLNKKIFACMYFNYLVASWELAKTRGVYSSFKESPISRGLFQFDLWQEEFSTRKRNLSGVHRDTTPVDPVEWGQDGEITSWDELRRVIMRDGIHNSLGIALMPTATTSQILQNTESTEAPQSVVFVRNLMNSNVVISNPYLEEDLKKIGLWTRPVINGVIIGKRSIQEIDMIPDLDLSLNAQQRKRLQYLKLKYKTIWEISQRVFIDLAADRGIYVDQGQSLNLYFSGESIDERMAAAHLYAWRKGLKSTYYIRTDPQNEPYQALGAKTAFVKGTKRSQCDGDVCTMCSA